MTNDDRTAQFAAADGDDLTRAGAGDAHEAQGGAPVEAAREGVAEADVTETDAATAEPTNPYAHLTADEPARAAGVPETTDTTEPATPSHTPSEGHGPEQAATFAQEAPASVPRAPEVPAAAPEAPAASAASAPRSDGPQHHTDAPFVAPIAPPSQPQQPAAPQPTPGQAVALPGTVAPGATGAGAPGEIMVGDILVTRDFARSPMGVLPAKDAQVFVNNRTQLTSVIPTWAIVVAIVGFFIITVFSLFFLLAKEQRLTGGYEVVVTGPNGTLTSFVPVTAQNAGFIWNDLQQRAEVARRIVAAA